MLLYINEMDLSTMQISSILISYQQKRIYEKERYNMIKDNEDFKIKNRERAKNHYNKEVMNAKSTYYYYKKNNKLDIFKEKKMDKYQLLQSINFIENIEEIKH